LSKSPQAFRSISEAADEVGVPQHVLRFWEGKLDVIQPVKRAGGRRFYRPEDIQLLKDIRRLLHDEGMTIKGVERLYKEKKARTPRAQSDVASEAVVSARPLDDAARSRLAHVLVQIEAAQARLTSVLSR